MVEHAIVTQEHPLVLSQDIISAAHKAAQFVSMSALSGVDTVEDAMLVMLYGIELGFPMIASTQYIHLIKDKSGRKKPTISARGLISLARQKGAEIHLPDPGKVEDEATVRIRRSPNHEWREYTYTWGMAEDAGLTGKNNWRNYPQQMLINRAVSMAIGFECSDMVHGLYQVEEIDPDITVDPVSGEPQDVGQSSSRRQARRSRQQDSYIEAEYVDDANDDQGEAKDDPVDVPELLLETLEQIGTEDEIIRRYDTYAHLTPAAAGAMIVAEMIEDRFDVSRQSLGDYLDMPFKEWLADGDPWKQMIEAFKIVQMAYLDDVSFDLDEPDSAEQALKDLQEDLKKREEREKQQGKGKPKPKDNPFDQLESKPAKEPSSPSKDSSTAEDDDEYDDDDGLLDAIYTIEITLNKTWKEILERWGDLDEIDDPEELIDELNDRIRQHPRYVLADRIVIGETQIKLETPTGLEIVTEEVDPVAYLTECLGKEWATEWLEDVAAGSIIEFDEQHDFIEVTFEVEKNRKKTPSKWTLIVEKLERYFPL